MGEEAFVLVPRRREGFGCELSLLQDGREQRHLRDDPAREPGAGYRLAGRGTGAALAARRGGGSFCRELRAERGVHGDFPLAGWTPEYLDRAGPRGDHRPRGGLEWEGREVGP